MPSQTAISIHMTMERLWISAIPISHDEDCNVDDVLVDDVCLPLLVLMLAAMTRTMSMALTRTRMIVTTFRAMVATLMTAKVSMITG